MGSKFLRNIYLYVLLLLCVVNVSSCKEEEYVYPEVLTEFVDIRTDGNGILKNIVTDKGKSYIIKDRSGIDGFTPDSVYRTVSIYLPEDDSDYALLYSCQPVLAMKPIAIDDFDKDLKTDPVDIERIWLSGSYVNMVLDVKAKDKSHVFNLIDNGLTVNKDGGKTLSIELYHDRNNDYEAFTKKTYMSVPLRFYDGILDKGDSIIIRINTYSEGVTNKKFKL